MKKYLLIFVLLNAAASFLNYITYPALARILPSGQFVDITVALSLFTQISTFLASIIAITVGVSKQYGPEFAAKKIEQLQATLMRVFIVLVVLFVILSPFLMARVKLPLALAVPVSLLLLISIPTAILSGYLNGRNKIVKLGVLILAVAIGQFVFAVAIGLVTRNGTLALVAMAVGQILSLVYVYTIFKSEGLPRPFMLSSKTLSPSPRKELSPLIRYTILASIAVMIINILQIADLLIIKNRAATNDIRLYTDIYVVSRVVFFAGTIFIWPFLGVIDIKDPKKNIIPFLKLLAVFTVLSIGAAIIMCFYGDRVLQILFGDSYSLQSVRTISLLSILYKLVFLVITTIVLYLMVLHDYWAVWLAIFLTLGICIFTVFATSGSTQYILSSLNGISVAVVTLGLGIVVWRSWMVTRTQP